MTSVLIIVKQLQTVAGQMDQSDSDWPQLRSLAILALRGALKFFAVLNVLGEDFMVFWREHDELFNRFPESEKIPNHSHPVPFIFVSYCLLVCFKHL